jgi:hypothetical protein
MRTPQMNLTDNHTQARVHNEPIDVRSTHSTTVDDTVSQSAELCEQPSWNIDVVTSFFDFEGEARSNTQPHSVQQVVDMTSVTDGKVMQFACY